MDSRRAGVYLGIRQRRDGLTLMPPSHRWRCQARPVVRGLLIREKAMTARICLTCGAWISGPKTSGDLCGWCEWKQGIWECADLSDPEDGELAEHWGYNISIKQTLHRMYS